MFIFILLFLLSNQSNVETTTLHSTKANKVRKAIGTLLSSTNLSDDEGYNFCQELGFEVDLKVLKLFFR